jgi:hypothetical protein
LPAESTPASSRRATKMDTKVNPTIIIMRPKASLTDCYENMDIDWAENF